jgi:hypothetical protein
MPSHNSLAGFSDSALSSFFFFDFDFNLTIFEKINYRQKRNISPVLSLNEMSSCVGDKWSQKRNSKRRMQPDDEGTPHGEPQVDNVFVHNNG